MVKFNFKNSLLPKKFFEKKQEIKDYIKVLKRILIEKNYNFPESFLNLPKEKPKFPPPPKFLKLILLFGIGGSCLGAKAIYEALKRKKKLVEILFFESLNPLFLKEAKEKLLQIKKGQVLVFFISKSGKTLETIVNFFSVLKFIEKFEPKIFVVSEKNSLLFEFAKKKNYSTLTLPKSIVGRYSVFSNVGLAPLFYAKVNINQLLEGAKMANKICLSENLTKNPAFVSALAIFYHWKRGKNIFCNIVFPPELFFFGQWYCQLIAEGLGKKGKGISPTVSVATEDFHSLGQLFFDGPKDKIFNFVFVENLGFDFEIPENENFKFFFPKISEKKVWKINQKIFEGIKIAFSKKKIPFFETILEKLEEKELGFLMEAKMLEILFLGKLMKLNVFDQPAVELYKKEARKILKI